MPFAVAISLFVCYLLAALASSHTTEAEAPKLLHPIDKFMNTSEEIWVLNTTENEPRDCKKDKTYNMTENATYFVRSYQDGNETIAESLVGEFENIYENRDGIYIYGDRRVHAEVLLYASGDKKCGVVQVFAYINDTNVAWRDLRVVGRPNETSTIDEDCKKEYDDFVEALRKPSTSPYKNSCL
uniref:Putative lipocalin n=1 Tax=Rhipicephalus microplus TaxID=6941 RepID=A0A6G5A431_RHIMP